MKYLKLGMLYMDMNRYWETITNWYLVGLFWPLWTIYVSWGYSSQYMDNKMFQATNHNGYIYIYIYIWLNGWIILTITSKPSTVITIFIGGMVAIPKWLLFDFLKSILPDSTLVNEPTMAHPNGSQFIIHVNGHNSATELLDVPTVLWCFLQTYSEGIYIYIYIWTYMCI